MPAPKLHATPRHVIPVLPGTELLKKEPAIALAEPAVPGDRDHRRDRARPSGCSHDPPPNPRSLAYICRIDAPID
jgi:hypothetical protein